MVTSSRPLRPVGGGALVEVGVMVGVRVRVEVGVIVGVALGNGVSVGVTLNNVGAGDDVLVGGTVLVAVSVAVGVGETTKTAQPTVSAVIRVNSANKSIKRKLVIPIFSQFMVEQELRRRATHLCCHLVSRVGKHCNVCLHAYGT